MNSQAQTIQKIEFEMHDVRVSVEWKSAMRWRNIDGLGDVTSTLTQCTISQNNFIVATSHAFRDSREAHNERFAMILTAKKALALTPNLGSSIRKNFWKLFFEKNGRP